MAFRPLYDRILIKRIESETRSSGGLYIPDSAKEKPQEALVISIGNGRVLDDGTTRALTVQPGDRVIFGKYSGDEIKLDGEPHIVLRESDILAVVTD